MKNIKKTWKTITITFYRESGLTNWGNLAELLQHGIKGGGGGGGGGGQTLKNKLQNAS